MSAVGQWTLRRRRFMPTRWAPTPMSTAGRTSPFLPPCHIVIEAGSAIAGTGARDGDRSQAAEIYSNHTLTPESETSTHYFWHNARNFRLDDAVFTEELRTMFSAALMEDVVAIRAQQKSLASMGDAQLIDLNVDNASLQGRRLLEERIAAE